MNKEKVHSLVNSLIDYGPIVITVVVGAIVSIRMIYQPQSQSTDIYLQWILIILLLIAVTELVDRFRVLRSSEKKLDQLMSISKGSSGAQGFFFHQMPDLRDRFFKAKSIAISGVSLLGTSNNYHPALSNRLLARIPIRIMVVDPDRDKTYADLAVFRLESHEEQADLRGNILTALKNFSLIKNKGHDQNCFKIKVLPYPISYGIWIIDDNTTDAEIWVELYAFRFTPDPVFRLLPSRDKEWYEYFRDEYNRMWNAASDWVPEPGFSKQLK